MNKKTCTKCGIGYEATTEFFHVQKSNKDGLRLWCKICQKKYKKQYYQDNKEFVNQKSKEYNDRNPVCYKKCAKKWKKNNPDKVAAYEAKRRAMKLEQTPELTQLEQEKVALYYRTSFMLGPEFHIDHIHPLQASDGSKGLHHPDNLQILRATLNLEKSNKWPITPEEEIKYKGWRL